MERKAKNEYQVSWLENFLRTAFPKSIPVLRSVRNNRMVWVNTESLAGLFAQIRVRGAAEDLNVRHSDNGFLVWLFDELMLCWQLTSGQNDLFFQLNNFGDNSLRLLIQNHFNWRLVWTPIQIWFNFQNISVLLPLTAHKLRHTLWGEEAFAYNLLDLSWKLQITYCQSVNRSLG